MEIDRQTIVTPSTPHEGEFSRIAKGIDPIWKIAGAIAGFIVMVYYGSEIVFKVKTTERENAALKEQVIRQYNNYKSDLEELKKDYDEEMDVLEEELDKLKEQAHYEQGYKEALKNIK